MKNIFVFILAFTFGTLVNPLVAQDASKVFVTNTDNGSSVKIKWITNTIYTKEDVLLYRKQGRGDWEKLTSTPIGIKDRIDMPEADKDDMLQMFEKEIPTRDPAENDGFMKLMISTTLVMKEPFADFLGVFHEDKNVKSGSSYSYKVVLLKNGSEKVIGVSPKIKVASSKGIAPVKDLKIMTEEASDTLLRFVWTPETERYFGVNIYRAEGNGPMKKLNSNPIFPSGKIGDYADQFFQNGTQQSGATYTFEARPIDFFGNEGQAVKKNITMPNTRKPISAQVLDMSRVNETTFQIYWNNSPSENIKGYEVHMGRSVDLPFKKVNKGLLTSGSDGFKYEVSEPGSYFAKVITVGNNGAIAESYAYGVEMNDLQAPAIPQGVTADAKSGKITISWKANKEADLLGYRIFKTIASQPDKPASQITSKEIKGTSFTDKLDKRYKNEFFYTVVAVDTSLNVSDESKRVGAIMPDVIPPIPPFIKDIKVTATTVLLQWLPGTDEDLKSYQLFRSLSKDNAWKKIGNELNASITSYTDENLATGQKYYYRLQAYDQTGNASEFSEVYVGKPWAIAKNTQLSNFELKYDTKSKGVKLSWKPTVTKGIKGAIIMRSNGVEKLSPASPMITGNTYLDTKVIANQNYKYTVKVYYETGEIASSEAKTIDVK